LKGVLINADRRRDIRETIDIGPFQFLDILTRIRREAVEVASLPLCIDDVFGDTRFSGAGDTGQRYDLVEGEIERHRLQVVFAGPLYR
jgi:hypothetical protein